MGHRVYITDAEWLKEQREKFEKRFIERAKEEILGYDEEADKATDAPWCQPWKWSEGYNIRKPDEWFEMIKKNLENVTDEEFYFHVGGNFDEDEQMEFDF